MTRDQRMDPKRCKNDLQRHHLRCIDEHGVSILGVSPGPSDEATGPVWTYSIGLWQQYRHPEVLIIGLEQKHSGNILNWINRTIRDDGRRFDNGAAIDDVLSGDYVCYFQPIARENFGDWFAGARWFYDGNDQFAAVQMIWPSVENLYPWQPGASKSFREAQPIISSLPKSALQ